MREKRILWALSSVGYGHLMRDLPVIDGIKRISGMEVDLLIPPPIDTKRLRRSYNVLPESRLLRGSGSPYGEILKDREDCFDLIDFMKEEAKSHEHDCEVTQRVLKRRGYSLIVGDEAFWMLEGFSTKRLKREAPVVFMSEFVGGKSLIPTKENEDFYRNMNIGFLKAVKTVDLFVYIGFLRNIPNERFGKGLPNQREWVRKHCYCHKPIVRIGKEGMPDKKEVRGKLSLPRDGDIYLGIVSSAARKHNAKLLSLLEDCFEAMRGRHPGAHFVIINTDKDSKKSRDFIEYHGFVENLIDYMWVSECVITQTGITKVSELSALGKKFISFPMDFHFEQEYFMGKRIESDGVGRQLLLRETDPDSLYRAIRAMQDEKEGRMRIEFDDGIELAGVLLDMCEGIRSPKGPGR